MALSSLQAPLASNSITHICITSAPLRARIRPSEAPNKTPEDSKHAAIRAPLQSVELSGGKIHNVFGAPLILVGEDGAIVAGENLLASG